MTIWRRHGDGGAHRWASLAAIGLVVAVASTGPIGCEGDDDPDEEPDTQTRPTDDVGPGDVGDTGRDTAPDPADTTGGESGIDAGPAELVVDPDDLLYREVARGESQTETINLRNIGGRKLVVDDLAIDEDDPIDADGGEFEALLEDGGTLPVEIGADLVESVEVTYQPTDYHADRATLTVSTRSSEVGDVDIPIRTVLAHPDIRGPDLVRFGSVEVGEQKSREMILYNRGTERLDISAVDVTGDDNFAVEFPRQPPTARLEEGESFLFEVVFSAPDDDNRIGQVAVESNDPDQMPFRIDVTANRPEPCMEVNADAIDFGAIGAGEATEELGILNCNLDRSLTVETVSLLTDADGAFSLEETPSFPTTIQPAQEIRVQVVADLDEDRETYGTLVVRSDDEDKSPLLIDVRANVGD